MAEADLKSGVLSVAWIFFGISFAIVTARLYIRTCVVKRTTIDDYIVLFTLLLSLGNSIFLTISASWGLGQHIWVLQSDPERIVNTVKYVYLCEVFAIMCPCFGRIAFALMLISLLPPNKISRRVLQAVIVASFVIDVGTVSISFAQCKPIEAFWDGRPEPNCWPKKVQQSVGFFQGAVGSMIDLTLAIFPASLFWNLNMGWKQKVALSSIMGLGLFAMIASIVKTINLRALTATFDLTYEMAVLAIWWTLEANFVIVAVTIPTLRPILRNSKNSSSQRNGTGENSAYEPWRGPHDAGLGGGNGSFEPLHEMVSMNNTSIEEDSLPVLESHSSSQVQGGGVERHVDLGNNIQRDIVVSVTYSQAKPRFKRKTSDAK